MKPYWELGGNIIYLGHIIDVLDSTKETSVHCCVTSPPYYGLRNYTLPAQVWAPDGPMCADSDHKWHENWSGKVTSYKNKPLSKNIGGDDGSRERKRHHLGDTCLRCGAWRGSLGLEPTPELYVWHIVSIFRAVKRVLRNDGTLWLNIGDSYSGSGSSQVQRVGIAGLPPKNLIGLPWMVAFALQADGWILRSEIIWEKTNNMPESAGDRPTRSHEHVFLFSKKQRYFYDKHAILEPYTEPMNRWGGEVLKHETLKHTKYFEMQGIGQSSILRAGRGMRPNPNGRNKRTIWRIPSRPFAGDHFAVFPPGLPEPCILAGTSEKGCCEACGAPWARVVEAEFIPQQDVSAEKCVRGSGNQKAMDQSNLWEGFPRGYTIYHTVGWKPTCKCYSLFEILPCTVLDPFFGTGTTGETALKHNRQFIGIDLSQSYLDEDAIPRIEAEMSQYKLPLRVKDEQNRH